MTSAAKMSGPIADASERERCLDVTQSFVVQAAAGSGKTGLLVLRFLALLARVPRPEAVLAMTFTRKAAGEMRRRIIEALVDAGKRKSPPTGDFERQRFELARTVLERDAELGWRLLHSPSRLQVFTIDGFCSRIVAGTPLLSRLGSTPQVVDDATAHYRDAVRRTLGPAGRELLGEKLEILLERYEMGMENLENQLVEMLERRDQWREGALRSHHDEEDWARSIEAGFARGVAVEVAAIAEGAEPALVERIHGIARRSRAEKGPGTSWPTLGDTDSLASGADSARAWRQAAALLTKEKPFRLRSSRTRDADVHGTDAGLKAAFGGLVDELAALGPAWLERLRVASKLPASAEFSDDGRAALAALVAVLRQADANLWQVFRAAREVDHVEIAMSAVAALAPGETLEKLDARIEHILVDEFQDTNVLQCDLLRGLSSGWQPGDGRTLFLVGDPMQSIYRFRKAEVGLFLAARSRPGFIETCPLVRRTLSVNFRSTRSVVGWVNRVFAALLGDRDDAARSLVAFAGAIPKPDAEGGSDVDFVLWSGEAASGPADDGAAGADLDDSDEDVDADEIEAAGLADWIAERVRTSPRVSAAPAAPIGVLVRARAHALPLLRALEQRAPGVRVRASGLDHLGDRTTAIDLEALARALLHPGDRLSWLALLRTPWIGLSLADLAALVEPEVERAGRDAQPVPLLLRDQAALVRVSADARARIARLLAITDAAQAELSSRRVDIVVRSAWLRLGGPASARERLGQDALDAEAFFDLLAARVRDGRVDLDELAEAIRKADAPVDRETNIDVEIMTIHKAKGLEFDTVVLPALDRRSGRTNSPPLALETEPDTGRLRLVAPRAARGREDSDGDKYDFLQFREARRGDAETLRLLYVAATRARQCLLLSASAGRLTKEGQAGAGSLLKALSPAIQVSDARSMTVKPVEAAAAPPLTRFGAAFALAGPASVADRSVVSAMPSLLGETTPEFFAEGKLPAHIGTVFHAFAERIAADGPGAWTREHIVAARATIAHRLRGQGVLASEMDDAVARVADALAATIADERGRWLLSARGDARSEWGMTSWTAGKLVSAKLDRSFVDGGVRWIVDFKTGRWNPGGDVDGYVAGKRAQYALQLGSYRSLLSGLPGGGGLPIRLALYFAEWPAGQRWQDITDEVDGHENEAATAGDRNPDA